MTVALIHQSCIETQADLSAGVVLQKDACVIPENLVYGRSQQTTQQVLINVLPETDRH